MDFLREQNRNPSINPITTNARRISRRPTSRRSPHYLFLEALEDRTLLSITTVTIPQPLRTLAANGFRPTQVTVQTVSTSTPSSTNSNSLSSSTTSPSSNTTTSTISANTSTTTTSTGNTFPASVPDLVGPDRTVSTSTSSAAPAPSANPADASAGIEVRSLEFLIDHHQMDVQMAQLAQQQGTTTAFKDLAQSVQSSASSEIQNMQSLLSQFYGISYTPQISQSLWQQELTKLSSLSGSDFEQQWLSFMTAHNADAVVAASVPAEFASHPEVQQIASQIMSDHASRISEMRTMLSDTYGVTSLGPNAANVQLQAATQRWIITGQTTPTTTSAVGTITGPNGNTITVGKKTTTKKGATTTTVGKKTTHNATTAGKKSTTKNGATANTSLTLNTTTGTTGTTTKTSRKKSTTANGTTANTSLTRNTTTNGTGTGTGTNGTGTGTGTTNGTGTTDTGAGGTGTSNSTATSNGTGTTNTGTGGTDTTATANQNALSTPAAPIVS